MAGYLNSSETTVTDDLDEWIVADTESIHATAGGIPDSLEVIAQKLGVDVELAVPVLPTAACKLDLVLSVLAPIAQDKKRAPLRLVTVLDKSGSMQGEKIRLVIETMKFVIQHLTERDFLDIIVFDTTVTVLAPLTRCNPDGCAHLEKVISRLRVGSQTNLSGGLLRGLELHGEGLRAELAPTGDSQRVSFGNKYTRLTEAREAGNAPAGCQQVHQWTMELTTESEADAALIEKVVYKLHPSFKRNPEITVKEPPFRLERVGWGLFRVFAEVHLRDGRILPLEHELCFSQAETFQTRFLQLKPPAKVTPEFLDPEDDMAMVRSTFLFTDGVANVGIKTSEELCKAVSSMLDELGSKRCTISTFGFGADHSADLLRDISITGQGVYCFIEDAESIGSAFGEALGGLLSVTHQNVRLSLELAPGVKLVKARTKYQVDGPTSTDNGGQTLEIEVGDLFAEERRDILLEISLPESKGEDTSSINFGHFYGRGFSVLSKRSEKTEPVDLLIERSSNAPSDGAQVHPHVERHHNRYIASEALDAARAQGRQGKLPEAREILRAASEKLVRSNLAAQGCTMTASLLADVRECLADLRDDQTYATTGSKKMAYMQRAHEQQRTCGGTTSATYCNSAGLSVKEMGKNTVN